MIQYREYTADDFNNIRLPQINYPFVNCADFMVSCVMTIMTEWFNNKQIYDCDSIKRDLSVPAMQAANWLFNTVAESRCILDKIHDINSDAGYTYILYGLAYLLFAEDTLIKYRNISFTGLTDEAVTTPFGLKINKE